jgi:integrase
MKTARSTARKARSEFPKTITVKGVPGITATVYRQERQKPDKDGNLQTYVSFLLSYSKDGKRHMEAHSDLAEAEAAARTAINDLAKGRQGVLELTGRAKGDYERSREVLDPLGVALSQAASGYAEILAILNGIGTPVEAARYFVRQHSKELPRITVKDAAEKCLTQAKADGKSKARVKQLEWGLNALAENINTEVSELTPGIVSRYLTSMVACERTKKNARDVLGYFGRWLVLHGYLERGTDLVEGVQKYSMKPGEIQIFTPAEIARLIEKADNRLLPYIVIGAFAGLRGAEIQRLDWSEIDLEDGFIEVKAEKAKTDTRRIVPIKANLKAWLNECKKKAGAVCAFKNVVNQLMKLVAKINKAMPKKTPEKEKMRWKKNALRHSYISYRVADCADVARVADESGNSPAIIRSNYLKRVKPAQAKEWFNVMPASSEAVEKVVQMPALA